MSALDILSQSVKTFLAGVATNTQLDGQKQSCSCPPPTPPTTALAEGCQLSRVPLYTPLPHFSPLWNTSLSIAGQLGALLPTYHSSRKSNAAHSYQCVQHFCLSKWRYSGQCLGFLTCAQMSMRVIVRRGRKRCKSFAPNVASGRKIPCCTGNRTHIWVLYLLAFLIPHTTNELSRLFDLLVLMYKIPFRFLKKLWAAEKKQLSCQCQHNASLQSHFFSVNNRGPQSLFKTPPNDCHHS